MIEQVRGWLPAAATTSLLDLDGLYANQKQPAIRAWGDTLLEIRSHARPAVEGPPLSIRRNAVFGSLRRTLTPRDWRPDGAIQVTLAVDPAHCAAARWDLVDPLYSWPSWSQLKEYLLDQGFDPKFLHEAVSPLDHAEAFMQVDSLGAAAYVESLPAAVLTAILDYFEAPIDSYLDTWRPLASASREASDGEWEVIVPRNGLVSVRTDSV